MPSDLHFHSTDSDGSKTPDERIVQIGSIDPKNEGIWALTDHDRFNPLFVNQAKALGIRTLWATEISARSEELGLSLHVTCYTPRFSEQIATILDGVIEGRKQKIVGQIEKLKNHGFPISEVDFFAWVVSQKMSPDSATNYHIAQYIWNSAAGRELAKGLTGGKVMTDIGFMRECLRENGDYPDIGYYRVPRYEPEISSLVPLAEKESAVISIAHPNFSFTKKLNTEYRAKSREDRVRLFEGKIIPILADLGIRNFEINALATPEWVGVIEKVTRSLGGVITYGSDNHGLGDSDGKHGVFGEQNPLLRDDMRAPIEKKLREFIVG